MVRNMAKKFSAQMVPKAFGLKHLPRVYIEADDVFDAMKLLESEYQGYRATDVKQVRSNGSNSGCAVVLIPIVGILTYFLIHVS